MNMHETSPFRKMWGLGYTGLLPIIPPDAELSAHTSIQPGSRGKSPGVRRPDGTWGGFDWLRHETTEADLDHWRTIGAGVGLKLTDDTVAIDSDTPNKEHAYIVLGAVKKHFGDLPMRIGNRPKAAYIVRCSEPLRYRKLTCDGGAVELLTRGKQIVVHGVHPKTLLPYEWPIPLPPHDELPTFGPEVFEAFFRELATLLPAAKEHTTTSTPEPRDPEALRGRPEDVKAAVNVLPNTTEAETYDEYRNVIISIKGALPDDEELARELVHQWAARYVPPPDGVPYKYEATERMFDSVKEPRLGADFLYALAAKHAAVPYDRPPTPMEHMFDVLEDTPSIWPTDGGEGSTVSARPIPIRSIDLALLEAPLPPREWLYGVKLLRKYVTFIASPGGVGKTAVTIAWGLAMASGRGLLHDEPRRRLRVWFYNLEDDSTEIMRRVVAACRHYGLGPEDLEYVKVSSGRERPFTLVAQNAAGEFIYPDKELIIETMLEHKIDVFFADPFLRSHRVSENENEAQDEVMRVWAEVAERTGAAIGLVHHTKKGAVAGDMDSLRGGSAQSAGARVAMTLSAMSPEDAVKLGIDESERRQYVRLDDAKNNMAPPAPRAEWVKLVSVSLGNGTEEYPEGDKVQVATAWTPPSAYAGLDDGDEAEILRAIDEGMEDGERYSASRQAKKRWVGHMLKERFGRSEAQAAEIVKALLKTNAIEEREYADQRRHAAKGLFVNSVVAADVFD